MVLFRKFIYAILFIISFQTVSAQSLQPDGCVSCSCTSECGETLVCIFPNQRCESCGPMECVINRSGLSLGSSNPNTNSDGNSNNVAFVSNEDNRNNMARLTDTSTGTNTGTENQPQNLSTGASTDTTSNPSSTLGTTTGGTGDSSSVRNSHMGTGVGINNLPTADTTTTTTTTNDPNTNIGTGDAQTNPSTLSLGTTASTNTGLSPPSLTETRTDNFVPTSARDATTNSLSIGSASNNNGGSNGNTETNTSAESPPIGGASSTNTTTSSSFPKENGNSDSNSTIHDSNISIPRSSSTNNPSAEQPKPECDLVCGQGQICKMQGRGSEESSPKVPKCVSAEGLASSEGGLSETPDKPKESTQRKLSAEQKSGLGGLPASTRTLIIVGGAIFGVVIFVVGGALYLKRKRMQNRAKNIFERKKEESRGNPYNLSTEDYLPPPAPMMPRPKPKGQHHILTRDSENYGGHRQRHHDDYDRHNNNNNHRHAIDRRHSSRSEDSEYIYDLTEEYAKSPTTAKKNDKAKVQSQENFFEYLKGRIYG